MAKGTTEKIWNRARVMTVLLISIGFGAVILSLFRLQVVQGADLKGRTLDQSLYSTELTAQRGTIYDRTGEKEFARSASVWTVVLEPVNILEEKKDVMAKDLAEILKMDAGEIREKMDQNSYFTYLKRKVEIDTRDALQAYLDENDIVQGVRLLDDYKRYYPYGNVASTVLGYVGMDNNGLSGLELQYDKELKGTAGRMVNAKNAVGEDMPFQMEQIVDAEDGYDLYLTIDETVQSILDKYLKQGIDTYVVENGAVAILMDVKTGEILGLSSQGDYDSNDPFTVADETVRAEIDALPEAEQNAVYQEAVNKQWRNKAVSDTYYPGSVFKICVGAMGLEEGVINVNTTLNCTGVATVEGVERGIGCWNRFGHGPQTFAQGLCNSCNPYFIHIGQMLGSYHFFKYFEAFGFTEKTGIDLPGESSSLYYKADALYPAELATESMGQNFGITPVQMITAVSAVANGGYLVTPHVVNRVVDSEGNIVKTAGTGYKRQVISEETAKMMSEILETNAKDGTANNGYVDGYRIAGKTGTSEKVEEYNKHPERGMQYIASYCGYAPADDPRYALLVFFDEPQSSENGGMSGGNAVAGPVFSAIMSEILPYLGVQSQYSQEEYENMGSVVPDVTGVTLTEAYEIIAEAGLTYYVMGNTDEREIVTMQVPQIGATLSKDGSVYLYTSNYGNQDTTEMPDFTGCSLADAEYYAALADVQINTTSGTAKDSGYVRMQNVEAGKKVKKGTIVYLTFVDDTITETFTH